jgi:small subunit ribosomal protein S6
MKKKYEGIVILNPMGKEDSVDELVQNVGREIEAEGATLEQIEQMGRQKFAYNARHLASGHYVSYHFMADPGSLERVRSRLKLNEAVHLQHYQVL